MNSHIYVHISYGMLCIVLLGLLTSCGDYKESYESSRLREESIYQIKIGMERAEVQTSIANAWLHYECSPPDPAVSCLSDNNRSCRDAYIFGSRNLEIASYLDLIYQYEDGVEKLSQIHNPDPQQGIGILGGSQDICTLHIRFPLRD